MAAPKPGSFTSPPPLVPITRSPDPKLGDTGGSRTTLPTQPRARGTGTATRRCCAHQRRRRRSFPRAPSSFPARLCFSALISQTVATHKGEGTARTPQRLESAADTEGRFTAARGVLCLGQARMLLPSSRPATAQKWRHKISPSHARVPPPFPAPSELAVLLRHLDPISRRLAGRAGAWERGQTHAPPRRGPRAPEPGASPGCWRRRGCPLLWRGLLVGHGGGFPLPPWHRARRWS